MGAADLVYKLVIDVSQAMNALGQVKIQTTGIASNLGAMLGGAVGGPVGQAIGGFAGSVISASPVGGAGRSAESYFGAYSDAFFRGAPGIGGAMRGFSDLGGSFDASTSALEQTKKITGERAAMGVPMLPEQKELLGRVMRMREAARLRDQRETEDIMLRDEPSVIERFIGAFRNVVSWKG